MFSLKKFQAIFVAAGIFCVLSSWPAFAEDITAQKSLTIQTAPLSPEFLKWQEEDSHEGGYIPEPLDMSHLYYNPPRLPSSANDLIGAPYIPVSYDLRDYGRVPDVRNQNPYGTCWAHAAIGAMESSYLTQKGRLNALTSVDLSELHMAWFVYKDPDTSHSFTVSTGEYGDGVLGQGGNASRSTAYMSRMAGPVYESVMPYSAAGTDTAQADSVLEALVGSKTPNDESYSPLALRLLERYDLGLVSTDNRKLVKQMIMNYGAVQISYYAGAGATSPSGSTTAYFDNSNGETTDHAVLIVGWDDNFSREKFSDDDTKRPSANGAWLVRNSWGSSWGDEGYFYMSYEQYIASGTVYIAGDYDSSVKHYGYDYLGVTGGTGYKGTASYAANVFCAGADEKFESVAFYTRDNNTSYDVYIIPLGTETPSSPVSGDSFSPVVSGFQPFAGYHTVKLVSPVSVASGNYFSVIVKFQSGIDTPIATISKISNWTDNAEIVANVSYITANMTSWTVLTDRNVCIKAFTVPDTSTSTNSDPAVDSTNFPDENFRAYVSKNIDINHDGYLSAGELTVTDIDLSNSGVTDLTGLALFSELTHLEVDSNSGLKSINITGLENLKPQNITCDPTVNIINGTSDSLPSWGQHSLLLSNGTLGIDFYLTLPESGIVTDSAYVDFTVNGKTGNSFMLTNAELSEGAYIFTGFINSIQMAEKVTAKFHYGTNQSLSVSQNYSACDYFTAAQNEYPKAQYPELTALVNAIQDYGHYVQIPLSEANGWTIGTDYAEIGIGAGLNDADITSALESLTNNNCSIDKGNISGSGVNDVEFDLELNSSTKLTVYLLPGTGCTSSLTVKVDSEDEYAPNKTSDESKYYVEIDGIPAQDLDKSHTIHVKANTEFDITVSPFSYVYAVLKKDAESPAGMKNAVTSLYNYCIATQNYREKTSGQ